MRKRCGTSHGQKASIKDGSGPAYDEALFSPGGMSNNYYNDGNPSLAKLKGKLSNIYQGSNNFPESDPPYFDYSNLQRPPSRQKEPNQAQYLDDEDTFPSEQYN